MCRKVKGKEIGRSAWTEVAKQVAAKLLQRANVATTSAETVAQV